MSSRLRHLLGRVFGDGAQPPSEPEFQLEPAPDLEEEMWLAALAADVAEGSRAQVVASDDFWQRIDSLQKEHEHLAMTWLQKLIAIRELPDPARTALRVRLLEVADSRGQLGDVIADAEALT
ncbi:MAG TPA: hypothetical protein VFG83_15840, partial [Kofleriaceae bacterium]|nr:hypothetical protein [Kofleriaceae bacterium]